MIETTKPSQPYDSGYNGLKTRDFNIKVGETGHHVTLIQLTDLHIGLCNEADKDNVTLMGKDGEKNGTYYKRTWPNQNDVKRNLTSALKYFDNLKADQLVITGDALDYLSYGGLAFLREKIWDPYKGKVLIAPGNHELVQKMGGDVAESLTVAKRTKMLQDGWDHDLYYTSRVLQDKVMIIQMDNGLDDRDEVAKPHFGKLFHEEQVAKLTADLELARKNRYVVLLFMHSPIGTGNPDDKEVKLTYDPNPESTKDGVNKTQNLYENVAAGTPNNGDSAASAAIWNLIYENSDIVAAVFAGHVHGDFYSEIIGKTRKIPQILLRGMCYEQGHALKITVEY